MAHSIAVSPDAMATVILEVADGCEEQSSHMTYALDMTLAS